MKIINLPSLIVIRLKRVKISLHSVRKFTAVYGGGPGKEGAGRRGGGASTTMSIQTSVNFRHFLSSLLLNKSLSNLAILLLGPCHKLKKNRERVFQQFIFVYSEAMKFHSWLKNSISFASQANELIMTYRF